MTGLVVRLLDRIGDEVMFAGNEVRWIAQGLLSCRTDEQSRVKILGAAFNLGAAGDLSEGFDLFLEPLGRLRPL